MSMIIFSFKAISSNQNFLKTKSIYYSSLTISSPLNFMFLSSNFSPLNFEFLCSKFTFFYSSFTNQLILMIVLKLPHTLKHTTNKIFLTNITIQISNSIFHKFSLNIVFVVPLKKYVFLIIRILHVLRHIIS